MILIIIFSEKSKSTNKLTEAVREYMSYDFLKTTITCVAIFSAKFTLPFLNFAEVGTQEQFVNTLPKLYADLMNSKLSTLEGYSVPYKFSIEWELENVHEAILSKICVQVAKNLKVARGREYGIVDDNDRPLKERGTQINLLSREELLGLPTNNILSERELAMFDIQMKKFARSTNQHFKGNGKF